MNLHTALFTLLACCTLSGCMQPALVVGQARAAVAEEDVVVYYIERPRCNFETVALLRAEGGYFSLDSMLGKMRRQAAELGASGLYVEHTQRSEMREYSGNAKAIRCMPV